LDYLLKRYVLSEKLTMQNCRTRRSVLRFGGGGRRAPYSHPCARLGFA
jgi:hypothetical protein